MMSHLFKTMGKKKKRLRYTKGFSRGKPGSIVEDHPLYYREIADRIIEFFSMTHDAIAHIMDQAIETIKLSCNIDPKAEPGDNSYIVPIKYIGTRDDIGSYDNSKRFAKKDEILANNFLDNSEGILYEPRNIEYKKYVKAKKKEANEKK